MAGRLDGIDRRTFLLSAAATAVALPLASRGALAQDGPVGPYGPLQAPDANGIRLPAGFTAREVARAGEPVGGSGRSWHRFPDGGATFPTPDGGWVYASNSEVPLLGGVGTLRFDAGGELVGAGRVLTGTTGNCAGGPTPWGTWLSCEEHPRGRVWECDPLGERGAEARPAMGVFVHEAAGADPVGRRLYLTEDHPEGRFYRFTPDRWEDLSAGVLEVAAVGSDGAVGWRAVPDAQARTMPTRLQVPESTAFAGGEGLWVADGSLWFTTKGDDRVWEYDLREERLSVLYDGRARRDAPLHGVDNLTVHPSGDLVVAEDGGNMELVLVTVEGEIAPLLRVEGQPGSELAGPAFDPTGERLYFSSQRGFGAGVTYEVRGPFRGARPAAVSTTVPGRPLPRSTTTTVRTAAGTSDRDDGAGDIALPVGLGVGGLALLGTAVWAVRRRSG